MPSTHIISRSSILWYTVTKTSSVHPVTFFRNICFLEPGGDSVVTTVVRFLYDPNALDPITDKDSTFLFNSRIEYGISFYLTSTYPFIIHHVCMLHYNKL